jgi:DNA-binding MarR family transcriptional regulator/GNAT superfamily N-acetyltransferase
VRQSLTKVRGVDGATVEQVRRFNRTVTERVGALHDDFLARGRPLGESRVLWEIGEDGCDVRELRARLQLDSGYVSRVLRSLEGAGLVEVVGSEPDRRVRRARLTEDGSAERKILDQRSDELAHSLLEPLDARQRERLVTAMADVERLLTAALVRIEVVDAVRPEARYCIEAYYAELDRRFDTGFDPAQARMPDPAEMRPPAGLFCVASLRGEPVGCGGLKFHDGDPTELKRLWVDGSVRGLGVGRRLLRELEDRAREAGSDTIRLDTNRTLTEAIALYRSAGYHEIPRFNDEPYAHHFFEKHLP